MSSVERGVIFCALLTIVPLLAASSAFADTPERGASLIEVDESAPVAVPEPTPLAVRYYKTGIALWLTRCAWSLAVPAVFLFSGYSARLRSFSARLGRFSIPTIAIYGVLYLALNFLIDLPLDYYATYLRPHAYGLSRQSIAKWSLDNLKALGVSMAGVVAFLWVPLLLIRRFPGRWWLYTGLLMLPFGLFTALIMPVWIDPLFNTFGEMKDKALEAKILALASEAGIEGSRVFEVDKSRDTNTVNAYVTGLASTKRIVLWDTLLAKLDEKEVLVVMAHEMGHYVLNHVLIGIYLSTVGSVALLYMVHRSGQFLIRRYSGKFGFDSLSDVAAVPLLALLLQGITLAGAPIGLAINREIEHRADRFALDLRKTNHSAGTAFVKLSRENLSYPRPDLFIKLWRSTHPPIGERIDFCNEYHPWRGSLPK